MFEQPEPLTFEALIEREDEFTFVALPFAPRERWGARPRYQVAGSINGVPVRGTLGALEDAYFLRLGQAWLRDSGLAPGAAVTVSLAPEGPAADNVADDIAAALAADERAATFFAGLSTYYRKNFIRWIESAKRAETRQRRIAEMIALLAAGQRER